MSRAFYKDSISGFLHSDQDTIIGKIVAGCRFPVDLTQQDAWRAQIEILKPVLDHHEGSIYFEYSIPRMGKRIDVVLLMGPVIFVLEFKVGEKQFSAASIDQVWDYALDLKNFHETSHHRHIAPVLIATQAGDSAIDDNVRSYSDKLFSPLKSNASMLGTVLAKVLAVAKGDCLDDMAWDNGRYCPTPTIIEAALALYKGHAVAEISRRDASAKNLHQTTDAISEIIRSAKAGSHKAICFVTGVPGAGKTLIGLNIATQHLNQRNDMYSVFLSGNGPLVKVLQEALARDKVSREKEQKRKIKKGVASSEVKMFVQNVHHYRDEYLRDSKPPVDHVALFDEAQRAWNLQKTSDFMRRKKKRPDFQQSEPEFLISCVDRHPDWGVIVCLVGGGQEINTGEAGIGAWLEALQRRFSGWHIHVSDRLVDSEYGAGAVLDGLAGRPHVHYNKDLHLSVSMRSFRAENVSLLVKQLLDLDVNGARKTLDQIKTKNYPIVITRDLIKAKQWLKAQARGSERYGMIVSSQAERLKPHAIDVRSPMNPVHWFLADKRDVRSSYYLEDVATEFHIQGLELDWACITWDADFRYAENGWQHREFRGHKWNQIHKADRQIYQKNAYRVLLTRARQGMVVVVPSGDPEDPTRKPSYYDGTYQYLKSIGFETI